MHKALHPRNDVDRLYVSRKEGGRRLASIEGSIDVSRQILEDYIGKAERGLITAIRKNIVKTIDNWMTTTWKNGKENNSMGSLNDLQTTYHKVKPGSG